MLPRKQVVAIDGKWQYTYILLYSVIYIYTVYLYYFIDTSRDTFYLISIHIKLTVVDQTTVSLRP